MVAGVCENIFMKQRVEITVRGLVQGVLFRQSVKALADKEGILGCVGNEKDGSVTIIAEGEKSAIDKLVAFCKSGPQHAEIEDIEATRTKTTGEFSAFNVS